MPRFALHKIETAKGKVQFFKLIIDDNCKFDEFIEELKRKKKDDIIGSIFHTISAVSNEMRLPGSKFKLLQRDNNTKDPVRDYEIKKNDKRVYLFELDKDKIIVFGGSKAKQSRDIKRLRKIKKEYFESLKS